MDSPGIQTRLATVTLAEGDGFELVSTRWCRNEHAARSDARLPYAAIEFMMTGAFRMRTGKRAVLADPNTVVVHHPGASFSIEHPFGDQNHGLTVRLDQRRFQEVEELSFHRPQSAPNRTLQTHTLTSPAVHLRLHRLLGDIPKGRLPDSVELEERLLALIDATLGPHEASSNATPPVTTGADRAGRRCVIEATDYLNEHFTERVTLDELGRATQMSPWRISRLFSAFVGLPVHRYLTRLRLREATMRISQGQEDLTHLALTLGFTSHSHFTAAFRREFGLTPSAFRAALATPVPPRL